ncbi:MAG: bidirectional hydrogenase complex protein HoxU [Ilumatobacter sp.]|uniref:bidirectional hydrogenase complex protein HoxU n=1 Tax=Ilumatobacter sp. TaxID=1967498 RepID=UPI00261CECD5|nr:bidirectional hydrogenase complex protein HoxU [Ilumatobacter sp.]MDJ0770089.1 bidirectional hydrogenase complex protein HoxU [Ilumatobacter sp.]
MPDRRPTVTVSFDGVEVEAYADESILQCARRNSVDIPSLCFLEGLSVWGGCRLCVVEVAEDLRLRPACATAVVADMEVKTETPRLRAYRKSILELLFAEGNHVCAVCVSNGNCELQDMAVRCGMDHVRYDLQSPARQIDASHPKYTFDPNRCILCTRCVRVCDEIEGAHVWDIGARGEQAELVTELNRPWGESTSCTWCGKCVAVCPTGSLAYQGTAVGEMQHDPDMIARLAAARQHGEWNAPDESGRR